VDVVGCGSVTYALTPAQNFITLDSTALQITVAPTSASQIGTYFLSLVGSLALDSTVTSLTVNFTMTVNDCVVTSIVKSTSMMAS
jgi:hypothetical protein